MNWTTLVDADALAAALASEELRIVDARFALMDPVAGRRGYQVSHLPGAVYADPSRRAAYLKMYGNICFDTRENYINFPWSSETR